MSDIPYLLGQLELVRKLLSEEQSSGPNPAARREACAITRRVSVALEDAGDMIDRVAYQVFADSSFPILAPAVDIDIFDVSPWRML